MSFPWQKKPPTWLEIKVLVSGGEKSRICFGDGVYLQIVRPNVASWIYRFDSPITGRDRRMGLGSWKIGLAKAREKAKKPRDLVESGTDPLEDKKTARARQKAEAARNVTFKQFAEHCIEKYRSDWRNKQTEKTWHQRLRDYVYPAFGDILVSDIISDMVVEAIEPISSMSDTASHTCGYIKKILDTAKARGLRQGDNPAEWNTIQELLSQKIKRSHKNHPALDHRRIPDLMAVLRAIGDDAKAAERWDKRSNPRKDFVPARCLEFAILTGVRISVAFGVLWSEIDLSRRMWSIAADRMKSERPHKVPLSNRCMDILHEMGALSNGDFVFDGGTDNWNSRALKLFADEHPGAVGVHIGEATLRPIIKALRAPGDDFVIHGFRATLRTFFKTRTDLPLEERRMMLAHAVGHAVDEAYEREDNFEKFRHAFEIWAQYCAGALPLPETGKVIHLRVANG